MTDNNYKKILYIEDNEYQRKLIIQRFEKKTKGFKITGVSTIKEAKELMSKKNFDLILTDYLLKGEEGFDIFDLNVDIPVILITAYGNEETAVKALKLGAYDYLIKDNQERFIQNLPHIINKAIEKYKSNKEAELNKERLRKFMDSATDSFILMDSGFKILEINKTALKYIGKSKNEVIGKDIAYINLLTEANELRNKYINVIKTGKPFTIEHTYTHKYFGESTFNIKAFKVGEGIGLIITDTTPSQKTQKQLLEERNRANQYLKVAGVMILALNKDAEVIMINPKGCEIIGYSEEEILNKNWIEYCIPNKDKEKVKLVFNRFCKGEIDEDIEKNENRILTKSGEERILSFNNTILYDDKDNIIGILSSGEDITEQKKIEEALKESEEKYRNIVETANEGILILDKNYNIRFLNDKLTNMFGYSDEEMLNTSIFDYIPEEYKKLIKEQLKDKMKGVKGTHDIKFIKKDNSELWAIVSTSPIYNPNKEYIGFIKMLTDITQRKKNEEKLKLLSKVFQKSNDGIVITDPNAHIIEVNKSFTEITGYSQEEAKEKNINILKSGKHNKEFYHDMWYQVTTIGHWQGEIWDRKKDGEIYPKWLSISSIKDDNGRIKYFISIFSDISVIKEAEEKLRRLAHYDMLTELPNRIFFLDRLQNAIQRARRYKKMLAVMFIDLDGFKNINDTLGHRAGDKLLVEVAKRLKNIIRGSDTVARLGGDEFIILMLDITKMNSASIIAARIISKLSEPFNINEKPVYITASIGIALYPSDGKDPDELIKNSDLSMYHAKEKGKNTYQFFSEEMNNKIQDKIKLERRLRKALTDEEFIMYYQPQYDIKTNKIYGIESLIRWKDSEEELKTPDTFINIAKESELIINIGKWIINTVCKQIRKWIDKGIIISQEKNDTDIHSVSINISKNQYTKNNLIEVLENAIQNYNLKPEYLTLEFSQTEIMKDFDNTLNNIKQLKQKGFKISIDDFGECCLSLKYIKERLVDILKLDKTFVKEILNNNEYKEIAKAIISLSSNLNIDTIAVGVENNEELNFFKENNCRIIQGFIFDKPLTEEEITGKLLAL